MSGKEHITSVNGGTHFEELRGYNTVIGAFQRDKITNLSTVTEFFLMGFSNDQDEQILYFVLFLCIYLVVLVGNFLIILAIAMNHHLHTPMYFFLVSLSLTDIGYITTTIPKSMVASWTDNRLISFAGCVAQVFLIISFGGSELALLTIMAYDRYVAICHPLQYRLIMNWDACTQMAAASWITALIYALLQTSVTFRMYFCGSNIIGQYFCDIPQLMKISCTDTKVNQILTSFFAIAFGSCCGGFIFVSYGYIFSAALRIPSVKGRYKAFSTCTPHLTVFSLFITTALFSHMRPKTLSTPTVDLISAILYTVLPPVLNPIIYSLRNKDIQEAVWQIPKKLKMLLR
ncbi:olfactory receptor 14A16-like [Rhineura floridana]|uniref:olfactory receptor 14A16-like n=1 Tax=Rhineura floridana TaxID=261503 RepID=UPI002AC86F5A|nr:olfactory receptor 14A16-like [Rhineura floridana]